MAQATLNFNEAALDPTSDLYNLYTRLYQGMVTANSVDTPVFPSADEYLVLDGEGNPIFDTDGNPVLDTSKTAQIEQLANAYTEIQMKNSAYLYADVIMTAMGGGGGGSSTGFVSRGGDSMAGLLQANYGFEAGVGASKIFEVEVDGNSKKWAVVSGNLKVADDITVSGLINLGTGVMCNGQNLFHYDSGELHIENQSIAITGDVEIDGSLELGDFLLDTTGAYWDGNVFYHGGNSNKSTVDWAMKDATVYGDLVVKGGTSLDGALEALYGFKLGALGNSLLYSSEQSETDEEGNTTQISWITLASDLDIVGNNGIKVGGVYVIKARNGNVMSFSAPGMVMNLGDGDNGVSTTQINLQTSIYDYTGNNYIITNTGSGSFKNGLAAYSVPSATSSLETYYVDSSDLGVVFNHKVRFGGVDGPGIWEDDSTGGLGIVLPYVNGEISGSPTERLGFNVYYAQTTSPFRNLSLAWSATLHFDTDAEFFCYDKPVEAEYFSIKSDNYKTRLIEDALFFDDGKFIEGVVDGLRYAGNGYFTGDISSPSFASGFAGYGWAVKTDTTQGGFHATFDSLTVRKKMRVYELEVQKTSCTNGSLWVSDSCSGDEVIAII